LLLLLLWSLLVAAGQRLQEGSARLDCWASDSPLLLLLLLVLPLVPVVLLSVLLLSVLDPALVGASSWHVLLSMLLLAGPVLSVVLADSAQKPQSCGDCALGPMVASS
jgi:hypothetical protein